jgi:hypothetical protein
MSVTEVETVVVWPPGTYVTWGEGFADDPARSYGTIEETCDDKFYRVRRDDGMDVNLDFSEVVPAYKKDLDGIPDVNGKLVRVGDFVGYERSDKGVMPVRVTEIRPQEKRDEHGRYGAHTGMLDLHFSQVSVTGYGSGMTIFDVGDLNYRGDWKGGRSRDPHDDGRGLKRSWRLGSASSRTSWSFCCDSERSGR